MRAIIEKRRLACSLSGYGNVSAAVTARLSCLGSGIVVNSRKTRING
jgi:hypothetical protein